MTALIAEDLLLLLLDDERGTASSGLVDPGTPLAAAVLAELAVRGAVRVEDGSWGSQRLVATGAAVTDPVLARVLQVVAETPRTPGSLIGRVKPGLEAELAARLERDGMLRRHDDRVLGLFPRTTWPAADAAHEQAVRNRLVGVLVRGEEPDEAGVVLAGVLGALGVLPKALGLRGDDARAATRRAKALAAGEWAPKAVSAAVQAMVVAVVTPLIVTSTTTTTLLGG